MYFKTFQGMFGGLKKEMVGFSFLGGCVLNKDMTVFSRLLACAFPNERRG